MCTKNYNLNLAWRVGNLSLPTRRLHDGEAKTPPSGRAEVGNLFDTGA